MEYLGTEPHKVLTARHQEFLFYLGGVPKVAYCAASTLDKMVEA